MLRPAVCRHVVSPAIPTSRVALLVAGRSWHLHIKFSTFVGSMAAIKKERAMFTHLDVTPSESGDREATRKDSLGLRTDYLTKVLQITADVSALPRSAPGHQPARSGDSLSPSTVRGMLSPLWPSWLRDLQKQLEARRREDNAVTGARCQPDIVLAGAAKCATTTLHEWIVHHPDVLAPQYKVGGWLSVPGTPGNHCRRASTV